MVVLLSAFSGRRAIVMVDTTVFVSNIGAKRNK